MSFEYQLTAEDLREAMAEQHKLMVREAQRRNLPTVIAFLVLVALYICFYLTIAPLPKATSAPDKFFQIMEELRMLILPLFAMGTVGQLLLHRRSARNWLRVLCIAALSLLLLSGPSLSRLMMTEDASDHQFAKLLRALNPAILWCAALIYFAAVVIQNQRAAFQQFWNGQPHLHGIKAIRFDDAGLTIEDATLSVHYSWHAFNRVVETPNVIVLFLGIMYEPISKRGVSGDQMVRLRELLANHVESRVAAFPVIVAASAKGQTSSSLETSD